MKKKKINKRKNKEAAAARGLVREMLQYLQTPHGGVGSVGELPPGQLAGSTLVTRDPAGQEALVAGAVGDGVGSGARQAEQHRVIGQANVGQAQPQPLAVEVAGPGLLAVLRLAGEGTADKGGKRQRVRSLGSLNPCGQRSALRSADSPAVVGRFRRSFSLLR